MVTCILDRASETGVQVNEAPDAANRKGDVLNLANVLVLWL